MPRKKMQRPTAPQDQGYGESGEQLAAQNQMGLPDNSGPVLSAPAPGAVASAPPAPGAPAATNPAALLDMMKSMPPPPPGGLARPSERPQEAIMQGAGVSATPARNVAAEAFDQMAQATGDPRFTKLAARARSI